MKILKLKIAIVFLATCNLLCSQNKQESRVFDVDSTSVVKLDFQTAAFIEIIPSSSKQLKIELDIQYTDWFGKDLNDQFKIQQRRKGTNLTLGTELENFSFNYLAPSTSSKETRNELVKMSKTKNFKGLLSGTKITIYLPKVKEFYLNSQLAKVNIKGVQNSLFIDTVDDIELSTPKELTATYVLSSLSGEVIPEMKSKEDFQINELKAKKNSKEATEPKIIISLKTLEKIILKEETPGNQH